MKKTILISVSVILNLIFIFLFVSLQINDSSEKRYKDMYIREVQKDFDKNKKDRPEQWPEDWGISKTEFYDNGEVKYKRMVDEFGGRKDIEFSPDGKIVKERTFLNFKPHEEVIYYSDGNRKEYRIYESDNIVNIITNYRNGQIKSKGKKIISSNGNYMLSGRWIFFNQDGTFQREEVYN